ncbi:CID domain-containing protein [Mycena indigotica]|uniref:CID domain-containing protein n=1 Tax=Mycena indigotica TaxID=2126181 RepID=A0A8H6SLE8_9AGAR|nr:CID domain-containing protein [Mycena indigotica]KAF7301768.1 CID domain-containing protein [Mycena indigotica]
MYAQQHYAAPPTSYGSGYYYQQPPPPPPPPAPYNPDPNTFRRDYTNLLTELKVNSRPIIQHLSMLAQDFTRYADIVAHCIESHIRRVPPWMKLPAFYVLDAISKNVHDPYARQFSTFVVPLFLETYGQVDQATRTKMEEMLLTWRNSSPAGSQVFGAPAQADIERGIWGGGDPQSSQISRAQVLSELEYTLNQKERALQANPADSTSQNHISILHQLRKLVEAGTVSQEELHQILAQLRSLMRAVVPTPAPIPAVSAPVSVSWSNSYPQPPPAPMYPTYDTVKTEQPPAVTGPDIVGLMARLKEAGYVNGANPVVKSESDPEREQSRVYRRDVLSLDMKLSTADISRRRPGITTFLYQRLPAKCTQCGLRFPGTDDGPEMQAHLDMHFAQNRKANQNVGRGHSRSWFVGVEDWVQDVKGKGREGDRPINAKAAAAAATAKRDAELRAQYVVVPRGEEATAVSCPICKEQFKTEFLDDDEEWVWRNAVSKEERVYHATCYAGLAAQRLLRSDLAASLRSHSSTPEISVRSLKSDDTASSQRPSKSPSPDSKLLGTKRKVDDTDAALSPEAEGTPRSKKLALDIKAEETSP